MDITIAGFFFLLGLFVLLFKKNTHSNLFAYCFCMELFVEIGYAVNLGGYPVNYRTIAEIVLALYCLFNFKYYITKQYVYYLILLFLPIFLLLVFPSNELVSTIDVTWDNVLRGEKSLSNPRVNSFVLQQTFQFVLEFIICISILQHYRKNDYVMLLNKLSKIVNIFLVVGLVEFVARNFLGLNESWGNFLENTFGTSSSTIFESRLRGSTYELTLFTKEASHYAYCLTIMLLIKISSNIMNRKKLIDKWVAFNIMLMVFAMSFSVLLFGLFLIFVILHYRWDVIKPKSIRTEKIFLIFAIFTFGLYISAFMAGLSEDNFFSRRILSAIEEINVVTTDEWKYSNTSLEWSNRVRMLSSYQTILTFLHRPLFGYGLGAVCSHGATTMLLSGLGVVGTYFWSKTYFFSQYLKKNFGKMTNSYKYSYFMFMGVNLLNSQGVRPFYELSAIVVIISLTFIFCKYENIVFNESRR